LPVSKARLERMKGELQFLNWVGTQRFIECLTIEQLRFFVEHGYVEETVTKPLRSKFDGMSKKALLALWREDERLMARFEGRSKDEKRFYLQNGYFPDEAGNSPTRQQKNDDPRRRAERVPTDVRFSHKQAGPWIRLQILRMHGHGADKKNRTALSV